MKEKDAKEKNVRLSLRVSAATARRLKLHSAMGDETIPGIVSRLVMTHLKEVVVTEVDPPPPARGPKAGKLDARRSPK